jgi:hypothetical protein
MWSHNYVEVKSKVQENTYFGFIQICVKVKVKKVKFALEQAVKT